ncbi:hypothetical protein [Fluviicola taffensis]|uniref:Outer membrane protein beta-barrel domain-containing protein n=1 Tax=Fluviicola taffensis (strain DSM 16823 / NCIMB 13979 / RW262) TaxID=755732 RepID=F2IB40_FLUTR|nr:hypothetical protein [Fluviicola taffensis]AEA42123.1 hypothetical protein Fluta_0113 [Fluviicola taffensis DSM 16823]
MKKYIVLLCCSISFLGLAQNRYSSERLDNNLSYSTNYCELIDSIREGKERVKPKKQVNYGFSINQSLTRYGLPTAILFTLHYKKHQFDLGPQFRLGKSINNRQKNIGVEFNYRYYITGDTSWFSSYVLFNADYFFEYSKPDRYGIYYSNNPALNDQVSISSTSFKSLALNTGYGIKFNMVRGFYLGSHAGIGTCISIEEHKISLVNVDWNSTWKRRETYLGFIASVFIGYKF